MATPTDSPMIEVDMAVSADMVRRVTSASKTASPGFGKET